MRVASSLRCLGIARLVLLAVGLCVTTEQSLGQKFVGEIEFPKPGDFRSKPWVEAFEAMHEKMSREYAFTTWKRIDWSAIHKQFAPRVADAQAKRDEIAFQVALREYVYSIPDGHCGIRGDTTNLRSAHTAGGYGFAVSLLENGRVIAHLFTEEGPAAKAGMRRGSEIQQFNGVPIRQAIQAVPLIWSVGSPATTEHAYTERLRYLVRAPVGTSATVTFVNPGEQPKTVALTAENDNLALLRLSGPHPGLGEPGPGVFSTLLPSGFGYIRVPAEIGAVREQFAAALKELISKGAPGLVVDLRTNGGGDDQMAADLGGFFHRDKSFYEYGQFYNTTTGTFDIPRSAVVYVTPQEPYFRGPVIALIGPGCVSSGEGVAWQIGRARRGRLLGFAGTNGSFGMSGMSIRMPGEATIHYPFGASLDSQKRVQIDSDHTGRGGVQPTIRLRRSYATMMAFGAGEDVELAAAERELDAMTRKQAVRPDYGGAVR
jgi:carboxyl-terminal processing protease